jgi:hypothetical protein
LRKNCAHVVASISLAHSGSGVFAVRRNNAVRPVVALPDGDEYGLRGAA